MENKESADNYNLLNFTSVNDIDDSSNKGENVIFFEDRNLNFRLNAKIRDSELKICLYNEITYNKFSFELTTYEQKYGYPIIKFSNNEREMLGMCYRDFFYSIKSRLVLISNKEDLKMKIYAHAVEELDYYPEDYEKLIRIILSHPGNTLSERELRISSYSELDAKFSILYPGDIFRSKRPRKTSASTLRSRARELLFKKIFKRGKILRMADHMISLEI